MSAFFREINLKDIAYYALVFLLFFFGVFSYDIADYSNYEYIYTLSIIGSERSLSLVEPGFLFLCKIFNLMGFSFPFFRGVYILVAICILLRGLNAYNKNSSNVPLLLYVFFPFALDIVQFRFFMASAIVIYSMKFLEEHKIIRYIAAVLLASTQQFTAIFYLLFLLNLLEMKKLKVIVLCGTVGEIILLPFFTSFVMNRMGAAIDHYSDYSSSSYSVYLAILYLFMTVFIVFYDYFFLENVDHFNEMQKKILYSLFLLIPFVFLNENFTRLYRGVVVLIYCRLFNKMNEGKDIAATSIAAIFFCGFMFYFHLSPHNIGHWNRIIIPLFENNFVIDYIRSFYD